MGKPNRRLREVRGKLGDSAETLAECLEFDIEFDRAGERLGTYAFLKTAEDTANSDYQRMNGRYRNAASRAGQAASYIRPGDHGHSRGEDEEVSRRQGTRAASASRSSGCCATSRTRSRKAKKSCWPCRARWPRPPNQVFRQLTDADLKFGTVKNEKGELVELSNSTFSLVPALAEAARSARTAFHQYYAQFKAHENTLAATLAGSMQRDVYYAKARGYTSALGAALFHDNVPAAVYDNLIAAVHQHLPALYRYLRPAAAQDEAARHPSLRHLRADPQRARKHAHLEPGRRSRRHVARAAGQRILRRARTRA